LKRTCHYFAGEAEGLGAAVAGEATGLTPAAGEIAGEAVGLAAGAVAGLDAGVGCGAAPSSTTEFVPIPGNEKTSARNIKIIAAITVAFSSGF
jgi:hypothetical protein